MPKVMVHLDCVYGMHLYLIPMTDVPKKLTILYTFFGTLFKGYQAVMMGDIKLFKALKQLT